MIRKPEFSAVYPRLLLQSRMLSEPILIGDVPLTLEKLESMEFIDWEIQAALLTRVQDLSNEEDWAAMLGARFGISAHGPLGFAALSAPHIQAAFEVIADYLPVRTTAIHCRLATDENGLTASLDDCTGDPEFFGWVAEIVLKTLESVISTMRGRDLDQQVTVLLGRQRPRHYRRLNRAFQGRVVFSAEKYAITIPKHWLRRPSPLHDESAYRANISKCIEIMARREQSFPTSSAVRHLLQRHFDDAIQNKSEPSPPPNLEEVASLLFLTNRTLIRKLHAESSSYKSILTDLRRTLAASLLRDARLTAAEAGMMLGYREPANFGRAFRRWYGTSPAAWRRR